MLYRRKIVVNLVSLLGGTASIDKLHKLLFLYSLKTVSPSYDFIPDEAGCYSLVLHDDIEALIADGILAQDSMIRQNWNGKVPSIMALKPSDETTLNSIVWNVGNKTEEQLAEHACRLKPEYFIKSKMLSDTIEKEKRKKEQSTRGLYTIGYEGLSIDKFISKLIFNNIRYLIDVRKNAYSMRREYQKDSLVKMLKRASIEYIPMPEVGIPSDNRNELLPDCRREELFQWYRKNIIPNCLEYAEKVSAIVASGNSALMCFEANPMDCHRLIFAGYCLEKCPSIGSIINIEEKSTEKHDSMNMQPSLF